MASSGLLLFNSISFCSALRVESFLIAGNRILAQISFYTLLQLGERSIISVLGLVAAAFMITLCNLAESA